MSKNITESAEDAVCLRCVSSLEDGYCPIHTGDDEPTFSERHSRAALMRWHCKCRKDPSIRACVYGDCLVYRPELWNATEED